jgi:hypothetical protein
MRHSTNAVNTKGWRRLPLPDLKALILEVQRSAVRQHLPVAEWRRLDHMRERADAMEKEGAPCGLVR